VRAPGAPAEPIVKGSLDRMVVRNMLSLAYMPRARACYLGRSGASPESRDLTGRVRLAIDVVRGEVERASVASSTLNQPDIDRCLRDGAYAIEVPRAVRADAPVTAILNLVFRRAAAAGGDSDGGGFDAKRRLCPDGACVGVIGPDGKCTVCGRAAES